MDISFTNVLEGARQYFQGLPAATSSSGSPNNTIAELDRHQQQQQQQRQLKPTKHRPTSSASASENDGSIRSEQHSAVPVYWDQQNEGQAAANLTNRDAPLTMSHPASGNHPNLHQHAPYNKNNYAASNGNAINNNTSAKSESGAYNAGYQPTHPHIYQSHISTVQQTGSGTSKTYYELQTNRANSKSYATQTNSKPNESARMYGYQQQAHTFYPPNNSSASTTSSSAPASSSLSSSTTSSSSQDAQSQYNYKMYNNAPPPPSPHGPRSSNQYSSHFYHPPSSQPQQQQPPPPPAPPSAAVAPGPAPPARRHLPVQPSNMYHHSNRNVVANSNSSTGAKMSSNPAYNNNAPANASVNTQVNSKSTYNGASYSYYPNASYNTNTMTFTTTSPTVSRSTYVNTPHPVSMTSYPTRPIKSQTTTHKYVLQPPPVPVSVPPPQSRLPLPKVKRESPLDLSVKTVRTSADSTLIGDYDDRYRNRYETPQHHHHGQQQQYSARAPKVDFLPNFAIQQNDQQQQQQVVPQQQQQPQQRPANNYYNYPHATSTLPKVDFDFQQRKRSLDHAASSSIPEKRAKVDTWRQNFDKQIDDRLNSYKARLVEQNQVGTTSALANGGTSGNNAHYQPQQHHHHHQQYAYYNNNQQPASKQMGKEPATNTKPQATKKVLNLLRTSLQNKGVKHVAANKKSLPEQQQQQQLQQQQPLRSYREVREVLQPSTDVMAPLQPKPGIVGRRNVSPFTAASLERNSNTPPTYKFHIPKAIDSVIISDGEKEQEASMGSQSSTDLDGFAAFLAARIRTKAELKQVGTSESVGGGNNNSFNASPPPKLNKESSGTAPPLPLVVVTNSCNLPVTPKKLFGRSDMKRSEVRSSSETSVFDFPDSDNETEMPVLERQSLVDMRKDRRTTGPLPVSGSKQTTKTPEDHIVDENAPPSSPFSLLFQQTCDSFVEQLKCGSGKKRGRRKKELSKSFSADDAVSIKREILERDDEEEEEEPVEQVKEVVVKQEPLDEEVCRTEESEPLKVKDSEPDLAKSEPEPLEVPVVDDKHSDTDSDTPLVHIVTKQKKKFIKKEAIEKLDSIKTKLKTKTKVKMRVEKDKDMASSDSEVETLSRNAKADYFDLIKSPIAICKPGKKPAFGDGSDFRPGWEEALYKYKKSIRIPMQLIQVTRPPSSQRLSTSLPDLDPCPHSPAPKTESLDSDMDSSNCSFSFAKLNYDSDQGSMKSFCSKSSILDKLLERYGGRKRKRIKKEDVTTPKIIPKSESDLLPTPSLEAKDVIVKSTSTLLGFRKKTIDSFKDAFMNNANKMVGVNEFTTVVLKARTRTETRVLKEKATIREVFGEDRPASAPPVTCVDEELKSDEPPTKGGKENHQLKKEFNEVLIKALESKKLEIDVEHIKKEKDDDSMTVISTDSIETSGKKRSKLRRKFSSGFDYIRKKKKQIKKEDLNDDMIAKSKRRGILAKATPVSVDDIQKEIKQWVLNKGVGETHLHRASRSGYTDITAYCLEKMSCTPSPKDNAGYTPLHEACAKGHLDIARLLLEYGAQVSESAQGGIRPLHEAAENGCVEIVRLLLSYGADPTLATYSGLTPLQLASDDPTIALIQQHLDEVQGKEIAPWLFNGPSNFFDMNNEGYNPLLEVPEADPLVEVDDIEFEVSEQLLPNLYILPGCEPADRWVLLQDLSNSLKIKSKETLLRQLNVVSSSAKSELLREMKTVEFLEKARCCQFVNANEKLNTRTTKIFLVKYTDKVKRLLNVEHITITSGAR